MATVILQYIEDMEDGFPHPKSMTLEKGGVETVEDLLIFLGDAIRASGYTYVDRLGWADDKGVSKWAPF